MTKASPNMEGAVYQGEKVDWMVRLVRLILGVLFVTMMTVCWVHGGFLRLKGRG